MTWSATPVRDWLARGTKGLSNKTINDYTSLAESNLIPFIGACRLKELTADNVDDWLEDRSDHLTTRTMQTIHSILPGPSGALRHGTRSCGTSLPWPIPRKARKMDARAKQ
jgi:hypothetical protein